MTHYTGYRLPIINGYTIRFGFRPFASYPVRHFVNNFTITTKSEYANKLDSVVLLGARSNWHNNRATVRPIQFRARLMIIANS